MKKIIAAGFVLLFTAGTALAAEVADNQGSFLDRVASYFKLRSTNTQQPAASAPGGRTALDSRTPAAGQTCTCVSPRGAVQGVTQSDGTCAPTPAGNGPRYQMP